MTSTSPEVEDECFVYPAITKRYSQVTLPNQGEPVIDNQDYNSPQPNVTPRSPGRPLRSTLKARSQFGPDPSGLTAVQGNTDIPAGFTTCDKTSDSQRRNTERIKSKNFRSTDHKSNSFLQKELEQTIGTSFLSVEPSTMSKRPSIQQLRKYSVVDPNALKYFEDSSQKSREFGICSALLIIMSYALIILTFPLSLFVCIKVVAEYERAVIFRLGRIVPKGARGPGLFFVAPCIDSIRKVDLRTVTFDVPPQEVLTKDSVTVAVDAVVYYRIYNPVVAITNVEDADRSTRLLAATTLRNVLGTRNLAEILSERESISTSMQAMLDDATDPWGVKVERVEVKDVRLPVQLQRAMAAEAEATREARAKVIAAEGEEKASVALKQAADVLQCSPFALQLRYLQTLSAISAEKNSTIIFPLPIDMLVNLIRR
ncbi:mechanosensory protein 2 [Clonorchis sinensis]|uniref:Mechanosensory protein 2 n=1 Tax=Clonorchis sinensis TaxID=79923 RepID=G7YQ31_CLOSI|nr:mechanosensory protein 2 [Clonorchis sinensis]